MDTLLGSNKKESASSLRLFSERERSAPPPTLKYHETQFRRGSSSNIPYLRIDKENRRIEEEDSFAETPDGTRAQRVLRGLSRDKPVDVLGTVASYQTWPNIVPSIFLHPSFTPPRNLRFNPPSAQSLRKIRSFHPGSGWHRHQPGNEILGRGWAEKR